jgi:hypothetical protein
MSETHTTPAVGPPKTRWTLKEAEDAADELAEALRRNHLSLPSVNVEARNLNPLVSLGRVRPDVLLSIAAVLRKGAVR